MPSKRDEKTFALLLIWRKNHSKLSKKWNKDLLLRQETKKKRLHVLEADRITIENNINFVSS